MMRGFYRWLQVVLPPPPWVGVAVFVWFLVHLGIVVFPLLLGFLLGVPFDSQMSLVWEELSPYHVFFLSFGVLVYGVFRAFFFHPALSSTYRAWLRQTPWTPKHPLPKGPVHLVWQDAVLVGLFFVLPAVYAWPKTCYVPTAFLGGYGAALTLVNWKTSQDVAVHAVLVLAGVIILLLPIPWAALFATSAAAALSIAGTQRSLRDFPWDESLDRRRLPKLQSSSQLLKAGRPEEPYRSLSADPRLGPRVSVAQATVYSIIMGWLAWTIAFHARNDFQFEGAMVFVVTYVCFFLALVRLARYVAIRWWPIGLLGRIMTLRVIIMPTYDRVFVAPLATIAVGLSVYPLDRCLGVPMLLVGPLALALALFITLAAAPTLAEWHFTGHYRLSDKLAQSRGQFEQI